MTAIDVPILPDCYGETGSFPHPTNCHWFIHCERNGGRSIQQCPHLYHYDVISNTCVLQTKATCITQLNTTMNNNFNSANNRNNNNNIRG